MIKNSRMNVYFVASFSVILFMVRLAGELAFAAETVHAKQVKATFSKF